jgi:predicted ATPase
MDDFPQGAHFVPLAAIRDPALVPVAVAQSIGLQDSRGDGRQRTPSSVAGDVERRRTADDTDAPDAQPTLCGMTFRAGRRATCAIGGNRR